MLYLNLTAYLLLYLNRKSYCIDDNCLINMMYRSFSHLQDMIAYMIIFYCLDFGLIFSDGNTMFVDRVVSYW